MSLQTSKEYRMKKDDVTIVKKRSSKRGDTLHVYIKPINKRYLAKLADKHGLSMSLYTDQVIEELRLKYEASKKK